MFTIPPERAHVLLMLAGCIALLYFRESSFAKFAMISFKILLTCSVMLGYNFLVGPSTLQFCSSITGSRIRAMSWALKKRSRLADPHGDREPKSAQTDWTDRTLDIEASSEMSAGSNKDKSKAQGGPGGSGKGGARGKNTARQNKATSLSPRKSPEH